MKIVLLLSTFLTTTCFANLHLAPPDFDSKDGRAIFVDFTSANYFLNFDFESKKVFVKSKIIFDSSRTGKPIFDLVPKAFKVKIDGQLARIKEIALPGNISKVKIVNMELSPGTHELEIENEIEKNVNFNDEGTKVSSAFWIRDLKDRLFLEQYIPSNLEFDQYQTTLNINFSGLKKVSQEFFANGVVTQLSPVSWRIVFPSYFTVSSLYFHTIPKGSVRRMDSVYKSIDGRQIPVTVYTPFILKTSSFQNYAHEVLKELESDYGAWPHPSLLAYGTLPGMGGMEHSGATQTSLAALDHEMLHSYFAKGVMPANGNSGWFDESIASWRDKGYQRNADPQFTGSNLGGQSVYKRNTDDRCYDLGAKFIAYLDYKLQHIGGMKAFLKGYFAAYKHTVITDRHFKNNLEFFSGMDFSHDFDTLIWGINPSSEIHLHGNPKHSQISLEHHRKLTEADFKQ